MVMSKAVCMAPTDSACGHDQRQLELALHLGVGPAEVAEHRVGGDPHSVEGDLGEAAGEIDRVHGPDGHAGGVGRARAPG